MYEGDTFWHLSLTGRIGLVAISTGLAAVMLALCWALAQRRRAVSRVLIGLGCFVAFDWLAPQVHYLWYIAVIDGLPLQWVIGLPRPLSAWTILTLQEPGTLSAHARAALGWACIAVALLAPRIGRSPPDL